MSDEEMKKAAGVSDETAEQAEAGASDAEESVSGADDAGDGKKADAGEAESRNEKKEESREDEAAKGESEESGDEKYMRLMADFQNYKRRTEKEKAEVFSYANEKIVTELLSVLDNFERALAQESADEKYAEGMELIFRQMSDVLTKAGLAEIDAVGKEFDPNFHHAVMTDDNADFESGQVTAVLQKGYTLHDKVIRPAMVRVNS
ncbi:molecular chaperone GrpE [Eubacterium pyruvativorans]|uniref:Protein GrpE n=1 Tax=Eubacterium pyruvativorans TaxID=155865 RepID=A0A1I7GF50_9FIRM|nr:nucleotide exchange factor GrpE [Eubacterium pyruvativorans]SFO10115.1 molecular chaperone GrpE [Eubacterium pyruvativorans]SFU46896.1 molecular chaperone GrpE [Eubacterium pyruvativorans]